LEKIAVTSADAQNGQRADASTCAPTYRALAGSDGWSVADVVCTAGPDDAPFEERHGRMSIGVVLAGTFQYLSSSGDGLMVPGALLLGNAGDHFLCRHDHGRGDRCVAFSYSPEFIDRLAHDVGARAARFGRPRFPPSRVLASVVANAAALVVQPDPLALELLAIEVASTALRFERGRSTPTASTEAGAVARATRAVRLIEHEPDAPLSVAELARTARLSPYHFIRSFEAVTGATPHQYLLRIRLHRAALRLGSTPARIADIALECGFGDISNFTRTFRSEFGVTPRTYRAASATRASADDREAPSSLGRFLKRFS